jgi:hypothetical protein
MLRSYMDLRFLFLRSLPTDTQLEPNPCLQQAWQCSIRLEDSPRRMHCPATARGQIEDND